MNTASNWPMGSTLAQLSIELQNMPFAIARPSTNSATNSAISGTLVDGSPLSDQTSSVKHQAISVNNTKTASQITSSQATAKSTGLDESLRWAQTR